MPGLKIIKRKSLRKVQRLLGLIQGNIDTLYSGQGKLTQKMEEVQTSHREIWKLMDEIYFTLTGVHSMDVAKPQCIQTTLGMLLEVIRVRMPELRKEGVDAKRQN